MKKAQRVDGKRKRRHVNHNATVARKRGTAPKTINANHQGAVVIAFWRGLKSHIGKHKRRYTALTLAAAASLAYLPAFTGHVGKTRLSALCSDLEYAHRLVDAYGCREEGEFCNTHQIEQNEVYLWSIALSFEHCAYEPPKMPHTYLVQMFETTTDTLPLTEETVQVAYEEGNES